MLPRWSATGARSQTELVGLTSSGHSGKSPTVVGEAQRRRIRKLGADGERTGDIAHLEARRSISLFLRLVKHYFRCLFALLICPCPRRLQNRRDDGISLLALGLLPSAGVLEGDHAFREGFVFEQGELALREAAGEERDAFAHQYGNDADIEFVDQIVFEEVARELL